MVRQSFILLTFLFISLFTNGQDKLTQNLLDTVSKSIRHFVKNIPLNNSRLQLSDTADYKSYLNEVFQQNIDSKYIIEIIQNSQTIDTSIWMDNELPLSILTDGYRNHVDYKYVKSKFALTDRKQSRYYRKIINDFNSDLIKRKFYYVSRPVFDNSKLYAVLTISNSYEGGMLSLYKKAGEKWLPVGNISRWKY